VFISAADTELAALSSARADMTDPPGLRLASMMHLQHPMSVDLHIDACASRAKLVVARVLGGASYWKYGFEQYAARLADAGVAFAALPGDDKPDPDLRLFSTVCDQDYDALWAYLVEGGPKNAVNFLGYCQHMIAQTPMPQAAEPLLRAGVYWPGAGISDLSAARAHWTKDAPVDQPDGQSLAAGRAEPLADLRRFPQRSDFCGHFGSTLPSGPTRGDLELHLICRW